MLDLKDFPEFVLRETLLVVKDLALDELLHWISKPLHCTFKEISRTHLQLVAKVFELQNFIALQVQQETVVPYRRLTETQLITALPHVYIGLRF